MAWGQLHLRAIAGKSMTEAVTYSTQAPSFQNIAQRFGKRIKAIRESKGYSQLKVSIDTDINRGFLSEVENGHKEMTLGKMSQLATYYDMTLSELLEGVEYQ
jgi:ribosome-binding protein aMBF1 (putative translation factor)